MNHPRLLDLFSGAGGAAMGYYRAGFNVVGVDIEPQPHYPFEFIQADAMTFPLDGFDVIHASPVCHDWSALASVTGVNGTGELLHRTLERLSAVDVPWVVENVSGAPLPEQSDLFGRHGVVLCGTMFGLQVLRHRLFETTFPIDPPPHGKHVGEFYAPAGHGDPNWRRREANPHLNGKGYTDRCRKAMGIDWMTRDELAQAIPPVYCQFIGEQLMRVVRPDGDGRCADSSLARIRGTSASLGQRTDCRPNRDDLADSESFECSHQSESEATGESSRRLGRGPDVPA